MSDKSDDTPAFPCPTPFSSEGITLRDYFAGQVIGHAIQNVTVEQMMAMGGWAVFNRAVSVMAYEIADAMIAQRKERTKP